MWVTEAGGHPASRPEYVWGGESIPGRGPPCHWTFPLSPAITRLCCLSCHRPLTPLRRSARAVRLKDDEDYCSSSASSLQGFGAIPHEIQLAMNNRCVCFGCAMILMSVAVLIVHRSWVYLYIGAIFFYRFPLFFPSLPWE